MNNEIDTKGCFTPNLTSELILKALALKINNESLLQKPTWKIC